MATCAAPALAKDYILAPARPDKLIVVDTEKMAVEKVITVEVQNEIPTDCRACAITPRARGLLNDALSGLRAAPADPGKSPGPMPTPDTHPYRELPGSRFQGGGGISKTL